MHSIAKNIFNTIFVIDLTKPAHYAYLDNMLMFVERQIPLRIYALIIHHYLGIGLAQMAYDDTCEICPFRLILLSIASCLAHAIHSASQIKLKHAKSLLLKTKDIVLAKGALSIDSVRQAFLDVTKQELDNEIPSMHAEYTIRTGLDLDGNNGALFLNGKFINLADGNIKEFQSDLMESINEQKQYLQMQLYTGKIPHDTNVEELFMKMKGVCRRRNRYIFSAGPSGLPVLDLGVKTTLRADKLVIDSLGWIYGSGDQALYSVVIFDDYTTIHGMEAARQALSFLKVWLLSLMLFCQDA